MLDASLYTETAQKCKAHDLRNLKHEPSFLAHLVSCVRHVVPSASYPQSTPSHPTLVRNLDPETFSAPGKGEDVAEEGEEKEKNLIAASNEKREEDATEAGAPDLPMASAS